MYVISRSYDTTVSGTEAEQIPHHFSPNDLLLNVYEFLNIYTNNQEVISV